MSRRIAISSIALACLSLSCAPQLPAAEAPDEVPADAADSATRTDAGDDRELPRSLQELELSETQQADIIALGEKTAPKLAPLMDAGLDMLDALAGASRRCKGDTTLVAMRAEHAVNVGEEIRDPVLDAINELHGILTPQQRRLLSRNLLDREQRSRDDRKERDKSRSRSVGADLDLSVGQMFQLVIRAQSLRSEFEDRVEPWRERYRDAVAAFAEDDFDVRDHEIAQVPAVAIVTDMVRDALRYVMPILEPHQCEVLADMIDEAHDKGVEAQREAQQKLEERQRASVAEVADDQADASSKPE